MHNSVAGLDVVERVAWKGTPGGCAKSKANAGPIVHANRAVAQVRDGLLYGCRDLGIFERLGMHQDGRVERAPDALVGEGDRALDVLDDVGSLQRGFAKEAAESFGGKANIV